MLRTARTALTPPSAGLAQALKRRRSWPDHCTRGRCEAPSGGWCCRSRPSLGPLAHLAALLLQAAGALLLPLPAEHGPRLLVRVGFVRHPEATVPGPSATRLPKLPKSKLEPK